MILQEDLLRQLLTDSRAYGSLLGSGGVGDPGIVSKQIDPLTVLFACIEACSMACVLLPSALVWGNVKCLLFWNSYLMDVCYDSYC